MENRRPYHHHSSRGSSFSRSRLTPGIVLAVILLVTSLPSLASSQNAVAPSNDDGQEATLGLGQFPKELFTATSDFPDLTPSQMEVIVYNVSFFQDVLLPGWLRQSDIDSSDAFETCLFRNLTESYVDFTNGGGEKWCKHKYDQVFCWDATPPSTTVSRSCIHFNGVDYVGNVTRTCNPDGTWNDGGKSDFKCEAVEVPLDTRTIHQMIQHSILLNIGYIMSLTALLGAFFIFLFFKPLRCVRNNIHWNLVTSFIILYILFYIATGTQKIASENDEFKWICRLVICLTNNAILTNFFWMLIEGVYLHLLVVRAMTVRREGFWMYMCFGWGGPILISLLHALCRLYVKQDIDNINDRNLEACWLNRTNIEYLIFGPVIICIVVNLFILVHVIAILVSKLRASHSFEIQQYWKSVRATFILLPLLGGAYFFFIIQPKEDSQFFVFYNYAAVILQSAQGFFVALFYVYMNQEVLNLLHRKYRRWQESHSIQVRRTSITYQSTLFGGTRKGSTDSVSCRKTSRLYLPGGKVPAFVPGEVVPLQCKMDCTPNLHPGIHEWAQGNSDGGGDPVEGKTTGDNNDHRLPNGYPNRVSSSPLINTLTNGSNHDGNGDGQRVSVGVEPELIVLNTSSNNCHNDTSYTSCGTSSSPDEMDAGSVSSEEFERRPETTCYSDEPSSDEPSIEVKSGGGSQRLPSTSSNCPLLESDSREDRAGAVSSENRAKWSPKIFLKKLSPSNGGSSRNGSGAQVGIQERMPAPIPEVTVDSIQLTETPRGTPV